jgi:hypothetical protein
MRYLNKRLTIERAKENAARYRASAAATADEEKRASFEFMAENWERIARKLDSAKQGPKTELVE